MDLLRNTRCTCVIQVVVNYGHVVTVSDTVRSLANIAGAYIDFVGEFACSTIAA